LLTKKIQVIEKNNSGMIDNKTAKCLRTFTGKWLNQQQFWEKVTIGGKSFFFIFAPLFIKLFFVWWIPLYHDFQALLNCLGLIFIFKKKLTEIYPKTNVLIWKTSILDGFLDLTHNFMKFFKNFLKQFKLCWRLSPGI